MPVLSGSISASGALVLVRIGPSFRRAEELRKLGRPVVDDEFLGLLDTGAGVSAIDPLIAIRIDLESTGFVPIHTPSMGGGFVLRDSFDATISLGAGGSAAGRSSAR